MDSTQLLALLSQYPIMTSVMTNLERHDVVNLLEAFGAHWLDKIGQEMTWNTMKRLVRCDHYGLEQTGNLYSVNLQRLPISCSATQKPCETCGWTTCQNCTVTPVRALMLLGYNYYVSSAWSLCNAQSFRCETCRPPSGKPGCSCWPDPVTGRYGRGKHTCFYCLNDDLAEASLGRFYYLHRIHHRGYFLDGEEQLDADVQVADCGGCGGVAGEVVLWGWCVYCGGLAENRRLDDVNSKIRKEEDDDADDEDEDDDEEDEDGRSDTSEEAQGDAEDGGSMSWSNKRQNYVVTADDDYCQKRKRVS